MKKFVATLLFFIFANSFFAGAFASSISGETLNLKVDSQTVKNLHSAVDVFEKTYNDFCDGRTIALCQEKFSGAFPNSAELKRTNYDEKNAKRFFELIAGFYNDLQNFNSEKNTIGSKEKDDLRAQIMAKKAKRLSELSELVKKVNEERGLLDDLDGKKRDQLTKENETTLTSLGLNKYDGDLDGYKDNGVEQHNLKDNIDLSKIPDPAGIDDDKKLKELDQELDKLEQIINDQKTLTEKNIIALKSKKDMDAKKAKEEKEKRLENAWKALQDALNEEKNAVNKYFDNQKKDTSDYNKKDVISLKTMMNNIREAKKNIPDLENHIGNSPDKTAATIKNVPNDDAEFNALIDYLKTETNKANANAKKLSDAKDKNDADELTKLKNDLLKAKQIEAGLLESLTGDKVNVPDFDKAVDELNKSLAKTDVKDKKNNPVDLNGKSTQEQKEILKAEIANVEEINKKLKAIDDKQKADEEAKLKDCEKRLQNLINPDAVSALDNPKVDSLEHCLEQLKKKEEEQNEQIKKIKRLFDELKKIIDQITEREIKIFDKSDIMADYVNPKNTLIKLEHHDGVSENMKTYQPLGYSNDGNNRKISFKQNIGNKCNPLVKGLGVLTYNDMDTKPIKELEKWFTYIEKLIELGNNNIAIMDRFISQETNVCSTNHNSLKLKTENDGYKLYDAVEECKLMAEIKECEKYGKYDGLKLEYFTKLGVLGVRESCYTNNFKNKCSAKDEYKWPVFTKNLTYTDMQTELEKCNEFNNKNICENYVKGLVDKINVGPNKKVNLQKFIGPDLKYPECINPDIAKKVCAEYRDVNGLNKNIFGTNFGYGKDVANCKNFVDTIITLFNNCPALKGRDISEFMTAESVIAECEKIQLQECNDYLAGARVAFKGKKLPMIAISNKDDLKKCKENIELDLCNKYKNGVDYTPKTKELGTDNYTYLRECINAVDELSIRKDIEKVINECTPKFNDVERQTLISKIGSEIKTVEDAKDRCQAHQIQMAVDKCNSNGKLIDGYSIKERNYKSVYEVEKVCFDTLKNKCSNSGFNWGVLSIDDMRTAYDKLKACQESQRDVLKKYLSDNFQNVCSVYKASAGVKYVSTGSKGTIYNDSGNSVVYIVESKAKTAINNDLSFMKTYAEKVTDYCNSNGENFDIAGSCYEQKFYDKDSNRTTTLKSDARDTVEKIMNNMVNVVCGRDVWLNISSKTKTAKNYKVKLCKYAAVIKNNCQ